MKKLLSFLSVLIGISIFFVANSHAFCVHNNTKISILATQISGGGAFSSFQEVINPHETKCCNWKNSGCNSKGKRDSIVGFRINEYYGEAGASRGLNKHICNIKIKAGGDVYVEGNTMNYRCIGKDY